MLTTLFAIPLKVSFLRSLGKIKFLTVSKEKNVFPRGEAAWRPASQRVTFCHFSIIRLFIWDIFTLQFIP